MKKSSLKILILLFVVIISCSKGITINEINKPIYKDFKNGVKRSYQEYGEFAPSSFKEFYKESKTEFDLYVDYRNKVLDSINLLDKKSWIIIQLHSHNYSGSFEETYIFTDKEFVHYYLDLLSFESNNMSVDFQRNTIESLRNSDIKEIYNHFEKGINLKNKKINLEPIGHPRIIYEVSVFTNKKFNFYKIDAKDYLIKA
ncbi:hypothetical protein NAT51_19455 [Flavobacterium amniphilum]|uniref:hypothetical protein n=1 Tax=Flavobacterium amniphilum TaxID=1834035 RepID=UPI00202A5443|nr:hypothetical protein [Flavobacterium amniphilum]MCL9807704.1 hypothetical protein [Flavobacterium amniphilum]